MDSKAFEMAASHGYPKSIELFKEIFFKELNYVYAIRLRNVL